MSWSDFNSADEQREFEVIPKGTLVRVRMTIKPGGFDDHMMGWTGGFATTNEATGSVYLNGEFVVMEGQYARRKVWTLIGLHSEKGPEWGNQGRAFIKAILNSARGIQPKDNSPQAQNARRIQGLQDLDGIEFVAKIGMDKDQYGEPKNIIAAVVTPDHKDYGAVMSGGGMQVSSTHTHQVPVVQGGTPPQEQVVSPSPSTPSQQSQPQGAAPSSRPNWAQ